MISIAFICCFLSWFCKPSGLVQLRAVVCPGRKSQVRHGYVPLFPPLLPRTLNSGSLASLLARVEAQVDRAHLAVQEPPRSGARSGRTSAASALADGIFRRLQRSRPSGPPAVDALLTGGMVGPSCRSERRIFTLEDGVECEEEPRRVRAPSAARPSEDGQPQRCARVRDGPMAAEAEAEFMRGALLCFALLFFCFVSMRRERLSDTTISSSG